VHVQPARRHDAAAALAVLLAGARPPRDEPHSDEREDEAEQQEDQRALGLYQQVARDCREEVVIVPPLSVSATG